MKCIQVDVCYQYYLNDVTFVDNTAAGLCIVSRL